MSKYFTMNEVNPHNLPVSADQMNNLVFLMDKLDKVREALGKPMIITSGLRDAGIQAKVNPVNMASNHIKGLAVDVHDEGGILLAWVLNNLDLMKEQGFYFEHPNWTPTWVHFQCVPPHSGKRFFVPNSLPPSCNRWSGIYDSRYDG